MPFALSPERERKLQEILERYPTKMAATLPLLHLCQEQEGYVGDDVIAFVSQRLDLPPAHVKGVVTFYTLYNQHPVGKHQVWVCRTLPCALRGASRSSSTARSGSASSAARRRPTARSRCARPSASRAAARLR